MIGSAVVTNNELESYNSIRASFSGLTLQEAYTAILAVKGYLEVIADTVEDVNEFTFN